MRWTYLYTWIMMLSVALAGCGGSDEDEQPSGESTDKNKNANTAAADNSPVVPDPNVENPLDLSYISSDCFAALVIHPQRILQSPLFASVEQDESLSEELAEDWTKNSGIDPRNVEQLVAVYALGEDGPMSEASGGVILRLSEPLDREKTKGKTIDAEEFQRQWATEPEFRLAPSNDIVIVDEQTVLLGDKSAIDKMLRAKVAKGRLAEQLSHVDANNDLIGCVVTEPIKPMIAMYTEGVGDSVPPQLAGLLKLAPQLESVVVKANLGGDSLLKLALNMTTTDAATELEKTLPETLAFGKAMLGMAKLGLPQDLPPQAMTAINMAEEVLDAFEVTRDDRQVVATLAAPEGFDELCQEAAPMIAGGVLAARSAARQAKQMNNLAQISGAMHAYETTQGTFPPPAASDTDEERTSWRVRLLPFLDEQALYDEYRRDELWDSEHNSKLIDRMPDCYRNPTMGDSTKTTAMVFAGTGTIFDGDEGRGMPEILDGTSNTILVVDAAPEKAVPWMKPEDLAFDPENPAAALGNVPETGFLAAFADGHVQIIPADIAAETLRYLIERADGQQVELP